MAMSSRSTTYIIGHKALDDDHAVIIELWRGLEASRTLEAARNAASRLMDETIDHCIREEEFMRHCGFPRLDTHRAHHQHLAADLRRVILAPMLDSKAPDDFVNAVCIQMGRWVSHILVEDAKLAPYARNLAGRTPGSGFA